MSETHDGFGPIRDDDDGFPWSDNEELIAVPERMQQAIAVYENTTGNTVIRQQGDWSHHEEDAVIVVLPEHLAALIEALQIRLIESGLGDPALDRPERYAASRRDGAERHVTPGASRSRRYRERKKLGRDGCDDGRPSLLALAEAAE
jgi:hypothetical protein